MLVKSADRILVTGANGFIGRKVVEILLEYGFVNVRCFVRTSRNVEPLLASARVSASASLDVVRGNLLSPEDCRRACENVSVIYHLAAGRGDKSYPNAYLHSVVATRNLLDAVRANRTMKRLVCVSSVAVYSPAAVRRGGVLDETCKREEQPHFGREPYCYAKVRQEEIVEEYGRKYNIPFVIVRPGFVYGPGNVGIPGRVGVSTFGVFLHLGGSNRLPLSYVDNCADAIVLAGLKQGIDGETMNIVDEEMPTSRAFLKLYKEHVRTVPSIYVPHALSYLLCYLWEKYSSWSAGQLPPVFTRKVWYAYWMGARYSNRKMKELLDWKQKIPFSEASRLYFASAKKAR